MEAINLYMKAGLPARAARLAMSREVSAASLENLRCDVFCQHRRRPEVNQAVVGGINRSWVILSCYDHQIKRPIKFVVLRSYKNDQSGTIKKAVVIYNDVIHFRSTSVLTKLSHLKLSINFISRYF